MRYAVLVTGPAGAGKSTFTTSFLTHLTASRRTAHLVNLDPAASAASFEYEPVIDIKDLVSLEDVMGELGYGPNGGLVYCFEYLLQNMDWLEEELGGFDDDYLIFDCPGQIELYTHHPFLPTLVQNLTRMGIRTSAVYLIESQFMEDKYKFFRQDALQLYSFANYLLTARHTAVVLSAMSAMVNLEIPWINIMSKMDLVSSNPEDPTGGARNGFRGRRNIARYLDPDPLLLASARGQEVNTGNPRFHALNQAIVQLIEDHPLVSFLPLDLTSPDSLETVISHIDYTMQYGEDEEPKEPHDLDEGDFQDE
ncbi:GPN-loop GTPase [Mycena epipterygia]|nr:GPN-loop GTPase [Mycena epipterygia]